MAVPERIWWSELKTPDGTVIATSLDFIGPMTGAEGDATWSGTEFMPAAASWGRFIAKMERDRGPPRKGEVRDPLVNLLGSIKSHKKIFLEANKTLAN